MSAECISVTVGIYQSVYPLWAKLLIKLPKYPGAFESAFVMFTSCCWPSPIWGIPLIPVCTLPTPAFRFAPWTPQAYCTFWALEYLPTAFVDII